MKILQVTSELPPDMASDLRLLEWVPKFGTIFGSVFVGLGALTIIIGTIGFCHTKRKATYV